MRLPVMFVHGIGDSKKDWAEATGRALRSKLAEQTGALLGARHACTADELTEIEGAYWKDVFEARETELKQILDGALETISVKGDFWLARALTEMRNKFFRFQNKITTAFIGDIIGYLNEEVRGEVYARLDEAIGRLAARCGSGPMKTPLTVVAHSLGTVIVSDYIYDRIKKRKLGGQSGFHDTLRFQNFFTLGSPLALFSLRFGGPQAFRNPIRVEDKTGRWINIFDSNDPVAMPLRPLNEAYHQAVFRDIKVNTGMYGFSHGAYFDKPPALDLVSRKIALDWVAANKDVGTDRLESLYEKFDASLTRARR